MNAPPSLDIALARRFMDVLVSNPTTPDKPTRPLAEWIKAELETYGVQTLLVPSVKNPAQHAGLIATIGPVAEGGIALSGHIDVVKADDAAQWASDPFTVSERGERLHGRGTVDMKGQVALMLAGMAGWAKAAKEFAAPVQLYLSCDEEGGFTSIQEIMGEIGAGRSVPRPRLAVVMEPTEMKIVAAHKGSMRLRFDVEGVSCHSSDSREGINPIDIMDDLNTARRNLLQELKNVQDGDFNPPYSTLDTTVSLAGSTEAVNVIPATGILMMHMRAIREKQMDEVLASFNAMVPHLVKSHTNHDIGKAPAIALSVPMRVPALELRAANSAVAFIRNAMAATRQARQDIVTVPFATEAPYIARHDIDVAVCGPGSIKQAHTRDEFISLADFQAGAGLVGAMMQRARLG